ncbi:MAG: hypothetical protein HKN04_05195 [Rhodothermaceae bacterium]|nr:hypothetical protein [Rhodothermaceae bacterium]
MFHSNRFLLPALIMAALLVPATAFAQNDRDTEDRDGNRIVIEDRDGNRSEVRVRPRVRMRGLNADGERTGVVIFRSEDGETYRFEIDGDDIHTDSDVEFERDGDTIRFTTPDGETHAIELFEGGFHVGDGDHAFFRSGEGGVFRFRTPDGDERVFEFESPDGENVYFEMPDLTEFAFPRFDAEDFNVWAHRDGEPFGRFALEGMLDGLRGLDSETRREMMELERRTAELAAQLRRAEGRERAELEEQLDRSLGELFELRGQMREARAREMEERAQRLREEAEALRDALRDRERQREALIEERKRDLLGEHGSDW